MVRTRATFLDPTRLGRITHSRADGDVPRGPNRRAFPGGQYSGDVGVNFHQTTLRLVADEFYRTR